MKTTVVQDNVIPIESAHRRVRIEMRLGFALLALLELALHFLGR